VKEEKKKSKMRGRPSSRLRGGSGGGGFRSIESKVCLWTKERRAAGGGEAFEKSRYSKSL